VPKLIGRGINAMISPLPRNKRAKNPYAIEGATPPAAGNPPAVPPPAGRVPVADKPSSDGFVNNPFDKLEVK
jgi:hypothetical protein